MANTRKAINEKGQFIDDGWIYHKCNSNVILFHSNPPGPCFGQEQGLAADMPDSGSWRLPRRMQPLPSFYLEPGFDLNLVQEISSPVLHSNWPSYISLLGLRRRAAQASVYLPHRTESLAR